MILAVIDHKTHELFIEKVSDIVIEEQYDGEEEQYIKDKYGFDEGDIWSWDYVTSVIEYDNGNKPIKISRED